MDIVLFLSEILRQQNSVGVKDLGTFYKKKFAGRYDKEKQSFLPPGYTLQFTSEVRDEELLQNFIAEKRNISIESAVYYISDFVEETNKKLELEHEANLENLGRLFFTEHEGLSFEPAKNINYGSEFYGLPPVAETQVSAESEKSQNQKTVLKRGEADEEIYDEIAEAPTASMHLPEKKPVTDENLPVIENVELDEVKDDLKHTLSNSIRKPENDNIDVPVSVKEQHEEHPHRFGHQPESEIPKAKHDSEDHNASDDTVIDAPEFIKEQHEEHPHRFGHQPESEVPKTHDNLAEGVSSNDEVIKAPEFIKTQHDEHPHRFGHQPESEIPKTYINLEDETNVEPKVIEAPKFIQEQHAGQPNRFGHVPEADEVFEESKSKSMWPKIWIGLLILIIIAAVIYFFKPDWFTRASTTLKPAPETAVTGSSNFDKIDTTKTIQDSIAKTDSILKANQVNGKTDTAVAKRNFDRTTSAVSAAGKSMFHVISVSYATEAAAQRYIERVKKIGLNATIAKMEGKRKKVSIASFPTREEAEKQKNILQKRLKGEGFYVKEIKNTTQP